MSGTMLDYTVAEIMQRWPATIGVFMDYHLHCIGCPIGVFHTLQDAADEHGMPLEILRAEVEAAIAGRRRRMPFPATEAEVRLRCGDP